MGIPPSVRIGVLGAARITPMAVIRPAHVVEGVEVRAVAARDPKRAEAFRRKHKLDRAHECYEALINDPNVEAIYNALPNGLHAEWSIRALEAGKHVLCEKPLANNRTEAKQMAQIQKQTGLILMEAFHYRYHPLIERSLQILREGEIGDVQEIHTAMCIPLPDRENIRYSYELGGGATMDTGCYAIHKLRTLADAEPVIVSAKAKLFSNMVDRSMRAEVRFADGRKGSLICSLWGWPLIKIGFVVKGSAGHLGVFNSTLPQFYHRLTLKNDKGTRRERIESEDTYTCQLRAFLKAVQTGEMPITNSRDSIRNMAVIDDVYRAAGLPLRGVLNSQPPNLHAAKRSR